MTRYTLSQIVEKLGGKLIGSDAPNNPPPPPPPAAPPPAITNASNLSAMPS